MSASQPGVQDVEVLARLADRLTSFGRRGPSVLVSTALRTRAAGMLDLAAFLASRRTATYPEIARALDAGVPLELDPEWSVALAKVAALQRDSDAEHGRALRLLDTVTSDDPDVWWLTATLQAALGRGAELLRFLEDRPGTPHADLLRLDVLNPFGPSSLADGSSWRAGLATYFTDHGLAPVQVADGEADSPLDRLTSPLRAGTVRGPLVTVVTTTYRPGPELLGSVRSILAQTWADLELLVVDDASGPDHDALLDRVEAMDPRVRVLRLPENGGTYLARNAALAVAQGVYVTGQDDDDWAHPQRIERQMEPLLRGEARSSIALALRATSDLRLTKPGGRPVAVHQPTFLAERDVLREVGGYLHARKGADRELVERVTQASGRSPHLVELPLSVYRLTASSLSRAEFGPGWAHTSRLALWALADRAHERAVEAGEPFATVVERVAVPQRFAISSTTPRLDVVLVADLLCPKGGRHPLVGPVEALVHAGLRVGLAHVEDARRFARGRASWSEDLLDLVNSRAVDLLAFDDTADVALVLVPDAGMLQTPPPAPVQWHVGELVLLDAFDGRQGADTAPRSAPECHEHARRIFGVEPRWAARTAGTRDWLRVEVPRAGIDEELVPHPVEAASRPRRVPGAGRVVGAVLNGVDPAVLGVLARLTCMGWDVRLLAPPEVVAAARRECPALATAAHAWTDELTVADFVAGLDHITVAAERDLLGHVVEAEALAAGVVPVVGRRRASWPAGLGLSVDAAARSTAAEYARQSATAREHAAAHHGGPGWAAWVANRVRGLKTA
ncbi:glycosyltransferase family 2 protein [Cellulomonas gilvus]|uniref:Glycosyl transferase family 2 n=1 Tax=Cellulomonas gilvus (strain ATCC 13127 / NRRL B-14078) TaxID=593907 RepID=F8A0W9_CELGA|nr:glycosyltransferase family 2 protein [Cellulomonas gilvus]AEI11591.1 glycosyl transferase family 2 [Cellulomonas gilvus ATCC 13127]